MRRITRRSFNETQLLLWLIVIRSPSLSNGVADLFFFFASSSITSPGKSRRRRSSSSAIAFARCSDEFIGVPGFSSHLNGTEITNFKGRDNNAGDGILPLS
ncbi:hypothetical protein M569_02594 [Genlisea aurea]|uniref:Uncharacterized protein n=1 Tax=Genlisea aurea TaxID=192259 RepID=S8D447_9LAMI|nr:hypothetical protein M569_02594 [Genlisea aurea]